MSTTRVAVQVGASAVRVAVDPDGGGPPVVAQFPGRRAGAGRGGPPGRRSVAGLVTGLAGRSVTELLLVHPAGWSPHRVAAWVRECAPLAAVVRAVPAAMAAAMADGARAGPVAVLDVGATTAEATLLGGDGRILACRTVPVGGDHLDQVVRGLVDDGRAPVGEARRVREAVSLLPAAGGVAAEDVRRVVAGPLRPVVGALTAVVARRPSAHARPTRVLLIGGVARTPLLAELLDAAGPGAGIAGVAVAARPEAAAVLGALALPPAAPDRAWSGADPPRVRWLPEPAARRRPLHTALLAVAVTVAAALLLVAGGALNGSAAPAGDGRSLVQYGYRIDLPAGWDHTGGLPERRRSLLTPAAAPDGSDLIAVELSPLGYDARAEPERAAAELRAAYDAAVTGADPTGPAGLTGYDPAARFAGREVTAYRQVEPRTVVDWYVVLDGDAQLSVGCRHTAAGAAAVRDACAVVVGSIRQG